MPDFLFLREKITAKKNASETEDHVSGQRSDVADDFSEKIVFVINRFGEDKSWKEPTRIPITPREIPARIQTIPMPRTPFLILTYIILFPSAVK